MPPVLVKLELFPAAFTGRKEVGDDVLLRYRAAIYTIEIEVGPKATLCDPIYNGR